MALIIIACAAYAYRVNLRRANDDPKKKKYNPFAILIAPFTLPFLIAFAIFVFIVEALAFGGFLLVFVIALIVIRKPFLFVLLDKTAMKIGEPLLKLNTYLLRLVFTPWNKSFPSA
jgi:hypothetical protein